MMLLFLLAYIGGVLSIVSLCILLVLPWVRRGLGATGLVAIALMRATCIWRSCLPRMATTMMLMGVPTARAW